MSETLSNIGRYRLLNRISVGGMAEIYRAKALGEVGFEKEVAIKRILPHMADDREFIDMFIDEAKTVAQLNHSNICQIFEFGQEQGNYFIALELVEGRDLKQILSKHRKLNRPMPLPVTLFIICKTCEALEYAHTCQNTQGEPMNIVHRDISPQNVLVSYLGGVKLIDFGIAKAMGRLTKTSVGNIKGKFSYMSPEQVSAKPIDRRSDIFACGTVLWEALTNRRLFKGDNEIVTMQMVRKAEVQAPCELFPDLPQGLDDIVMTALAPDPEDRYQNAGDLLDDLERLAIKSDNICTSTQLSRWMRKTFAKDYEKNRIRKESQKHDEVILLKSRKKTKKLFGLEIVPPDSAEASSVSGSEVVVPARPGDEQSGVSQSGVSQSDVSNSGVSNSGVSNSQVSLEEVSQPSVSSPGQGSQPSVSTPGQVSLEEVSQPSVSSPGQVSLEEVSQPSVSQSQVSLDEVSNSGVSQSQVSSPGTMTGPGVDTGLHDEIPTRSSQKVFLVLLVLALLGAAAGAVYVLSGKDKPVDQPPSPVVEPKQQPPPEKATHTPAMDVDAGLGGTAIDQSTVAAPPTPKSGGAQARKMDHRGPRSAHRPSASPRSTAKPKPDAKPPMLVVILPDTAPPPPKPDAGPPPTHGYLVVDSKPRAQVHIDGRDTGRNTPIPNSSPLKLPVGKHIVSLFVNGVEHEFSVMIAPGKKYRLNKTLTADKDEETGQDKGEVKPKVKVKTEEKPKVKTENKPKVKTEDIK